MNIITALVSDTPLGAAIGEPQPIRDADANNKLALLLEQQVQILVLYRKVLDELVTLRYDLIPNGIRPLVSIPDPVSNPKLPVIDPLFNNIWVLEQ